MSASNPVSSASVSAAPEAASQGNSRWLTPVELTVLGAIWGASFLFMRVAAKDFGAFALVEVRLALGALAAGPGLQGPRHHKLRRRLELRLPRRGARP